MVSRYMSSCFSALAGTGDLRADKLKNLKQQNSRRYFIDPTIMGTLVLG